MRGEEGLGVADSSEGEEGLGMADSSEGEEVGEFSEERAVEDVMAGACQSGCCVSTSG